MRKSPCPIYVYILSKYRVPLYLCPMKKRITYPVQEYRRRRNELHELIQSLPALTLTPDVHNLNEHPPAPVVFLDSRTSPVLAPWSRDNFDCREIKLVNLDKPAISLKFFIKHKYQVDKQPDPALITMTLTNQVNELAEYLQTHPDEETARARYELLQHVRSNPAEYRFAVSNFYRNYQYPYVSFRYAEGTGYATENTHLIAPPKGEKVNPNEPPAFPHYNVMMIDAEGIQKPRPANDHAQAEAFLSTFAHQFNMGKRDLFFGPAQ